MPVWSIGYDTGLSIQKAGFDSPYGRRGADDRSSGTLARIEAARCKAAGLASLGNVNTNKPLRVNAGRFLECLSVKLSMGVFNTGIEYAKRFATPPCVKGGPRRMV